MDVKLLAWISILCVGTCFWLYSDLDRAPMNYPMHRNLYDPKTGTYKTAQNLINLTEIIFVSQDYINKTTPIRRLNDLIQAMNHEAPYIFDQQYSDPTKVRMAAGPNVNQTRCGQHLAWMLSQLSSSSRDKFGAPANDNLDDDHNYELLPGRRGLDLANIVDTFGKPDAGFYSGVTFWPGSYRECSRLKINFDDMDPLINSPDGSRDEISKMRINSESWQETNGMHYCIARFRHSAWQNIPEKAYPVATIRMGVCLPETCDTDSFPRFKQLIESLAKLEMPSHLKKSLQMSSFTCLPDERSESRQIPTSGRIYLAIVLSWFSLIIVVSLIYEYHIRPTYLKQANTHHHYHLDSIQTTGNNSESLKSASAKLEIMAKSNANHRHKHELWWVDLIEGMSIRHSLKSFKLNAFRVRHHLGERVRVNLGPLDSIKILMALLVILGHSCLISVIYSRSLRKKIDLSTGKWGLMAMSTVRCVDTYFVFFGLLTSYTLLRKLKPYQLANPLYWIAVNIGIFLRVGPIFMLAYWFSRTISPYLASGPWWDYGSIDDLSVKSLCMREPWWKSIPYFGHLGIPQLPSCLLPGWFIVCYVQLSLLMPLITYIVVNINGQVKRIMFVASLSLVSCICLGIRAYNQTAIVPEGLGLYGFMAFNMMEKYEPTGYMTSLSRLGSVSVGILTGCLLHLYDQGQIKEWPKWLTSKVTIWTSLVVLVKLIFLPLIGYGINQMTGQLPTNNWIVFSSTLSTFIFPIFISIIVINTATSLNRNAFIRFMGHNFWHVFNRLGLLIYLLHWEIVMYGATSFENAPTYGFITDVMKLWGFGSFVSVIVAFALYLTIEAPLSKLLDLIANPLFQGTRNKSDADKKEVTTTLNSKPLNS